MLGKQSLDKYEQDLGFKPIWVDVDDAITNNKSIMNSIEKEIPRWTHRETYILELIKEKLL